jgi:hypothetical protein
MAIFERLRHKRIQISGLGFALLVLAGARLDAAQLKICASGCAYINSQLQTAINDAAFGDEILLQENFTYIGVFTLKNKTCAPQDDTCYITIRTGVTSTGTLLAAGDFPAANVRITPSYTTKLAKLQTNSNNQPSIKTELPPAAVPKFWRLKWLEFIPNTWAGGPLVQFGSDSNSDVTQKSEVPSKYKIEQCYFRGDPVRGQFRGLTIHANDVTVQDSYFKDIKAVGEGQSILITSSVGPYLITNTYLEGGAEVLAVGGSSGCCRPTITIASGATTTGATLSAVTDLEVGQWISVEDAATEYFVQVTQCGAKTTTGQACVGGDETVVWSPALPTAPDVPGDVDWGAIPANLTLTKSYLTHQPSWQQEIVGTPQNVSTTPQTTGGTLGAGTYFYKVVARHTVDQGTIARSSASTEVSCVIPTGVTTGSCKVDWNAVPNAETYYIYGRNAGAQNVRFSVTAPTATFTDTNAAGTAESVPTSIGTRWWVKNILEFKYMRTALIEGNVFEYSWFCSNCGGQQGAAILFTTSTNSSGNDSAVLSNITFRKNIVRHATHAIQFTARDVGSGDNGGVFDTFTITGNLFYDINKDWGASRAQLYFSTSQGAWSGGDAGFRGTNVVEHNTFDAKSGLAFIDLDMFKGSEVNTVANFTYRNNITSKLDQGLRGNNDCAPNCWTTYTSGASTFSTNVIADGVCSTYPNSGTHQCPSYTTLKTHWVGAAIGDYHLTPESIYNNAGTDGLDLGADINAIEALTNIAVSGNNTGGTPLVPPTITTPSLPGGLQDASYATCVAATGGTTPYAFAVSSGMPPTGLAFSSAGCFSGAPTTPGTSTFTVQVTGGGLSSTREFTINITAVVEAPSRPSRFGTYSEAIPFRRDICPTGLPGDGPGGATDPVAVGDMCSELSTLTLKICTATSPTVVWSAVGSINPFAQGGNIFGATAVLGTNDAFGLDFETNNVRRAGLSADGLIFDVTTATTGVPQIVIENTNATDTDAQIALRNTNATPSATIVFDTGGKLKFRTGAVGSESTRVTIDGSNVGIGEAAPHSRLHSVGSIAQTITTITGAITLDATHSIILCDASGAARTVTLPTAVGITGRIYTIKKIDSSANVCTLDTNSTQTIDGVDNPTLTTQYASRTIVSNGANWFIIADR